MKLIYKSLLSLSALMLLGACSSEDAWLPGEPAQSEMGVFFKGLDKYDVTVEVDDPHVFTVTVDRLDASAEATVPLEVVSCPEGVIVPDAVTFAEGESSTTFEIDATAMPSKTSGTVELRIDPKYAAVYGAGTSVLTLNLAITGGWVTLADDVTISTYLVEYPTLTGAEIQVLEGSNRFRIPNFLGSDTDLIFYVSNTSLSSPVIFPYTNCKYYYDLWDGYDDDTDYPWYFYNTEKAAYPAAWTPAGWSKEIGYISFYIYDDDDKGCYFNLRSGSGTMMSYIEFSDGGGAWEYFMFKFTPKFDPFATEE